MKEGAVRNDGGSSPAPPPSPPPPPPRHPAPPPPLPFPLPTLGALGAPALTPRSEGRPLLPEAAPAFPHPWRRGSPALPAHISRRPATRTVHRLFHLPVYFCTSAHRTFCCVFRSVHTLGRWSLICEGHWCHQHWAEGRALAQCRHCPVRACPVFSW